MKFGKILSDNLPTLLTSVAVVGVLSTTVLAVKATPFAYRDILDAESELGDISNLDKARLTWHYYIPSALMGAITISAVVGVNTVGSKRQAAIAGLYTLTDRAFNEYKDKVVEVIGEKKEEGIKDEIAKEQMEKNPVVNSEVIITGDGEHLFYDSITGRYFKSKMVTVQKAQNDINYEILNNMYASQNDFYREIGIASVKHGDEVGWSANRPLEIYFSAHLTPEGVPCVSLGYQMEPMHGYDKAHAW